MKTTFSLTVAVCLLTASSLFAGVNQGLAFGGDLPSDAGLVAVKQASGEYVVYALRGVNEMWSEIQDGERWPEYVARVNAEQQMPNGTFAPVALRMDLEADAIADDVNALRSDVVFRHYVAWGYFDVGGEPLRAVVLIDESIGLLPAGVSFPVEVTLTRTFRVVSYPNSDEEADETMLGWLVPRIRENGGGGPYCPHMSFRSGGKCGSGTDNWIARAPGSRRPLPPGPEVSDDASGVSVKANRLSANAAGLACLAGRNQCDDTCDMEYASDYMDCEIDRIERNIGGAAGCIGIGAWFPPAGLACAGAGMIGDALLTYSCRETANDKRHVCDNGCRGVYNSCCAQENTVCVQGS